VYIHRALKQPFDDHDYMPPSHSLSLSLSVCVVCCVGVRVWKTSPPRTKIRCQAQRVCVCCSYACCSRTNCNPSKRLQARWNLFQSTLQICVPWIAKSRSERNPIQGALLRKRRSNLKSRLIIATQRPTGCFIFARLFSQHTATDCNTLQHSATHVHTATHWKTYRMAHCRGCLSYIE